MRIAVRREPDAGERRVAATPESVRQLIAAGLEVTVEAGAGVEAGYPDADYTAAGATVAKKLDLAKADVLAHVRPLKPEVITGLRKGAITVGLASPASELAAVKALRDAGVTAFALELVPRISRAQSMDALTSQALVAGYRCVLEGAMRLPRFFPLFMTAAGTIPPAKVLVLGAGVAGLQAIATAKRLGAKVSANDVRAASADEVQSMGGTFIHLDLDAADAGGGYAKELAADRAKRQQELLTPHVADSDVIVTTAAIPGRPAPRLITKAMLSGMRAGSVIVDLAAESGGNVEGSKPGEDVRVKVDGGEITIVGMKDAASTMPYDASRLYAKNVSNLIALMTVDGVVTPDFEDEVVAGACLTYEGVIRHEPTATAVEGAKK
ncbi:Re/Si-specific NAD(P)(+) transhydrogenase subunit alpha [Leifsonia sp. H3M29-4]|uniref:Re/Si-specific NAD(P)(+) transhydrogenase subunit alpha n=1 Tax=Salinibacterium metalliresistens TaxID=3031321 RepID=UPI0023D9A660|nr:Re/Si-specific NAD(P)(+) transhydrogenase subunit alpha [Salinibacterium metalliresistens]MDF1478158.1 Re/Si-specific NAD(P)(+) transhydrogenase subunit alpha [Salinibacterium metalliresistens]